MPRWRTGIRRWKEIVGSENVRTDELSLKLYGKNVSGFQRDIPAILLPRDTDEIQRIVAVANENRTPLYPISSGRNWGLGSRLPVTDGCAIVDLSRMNRIREINEESAYTVIETGVTQGQLHDTLKERGYALMLDTTGSGRDTSIIGNALEKGVGYFGLRFESLSGLEVVLGNGKLLTTGFGHYPHARTTHLYKYGVGPSLDGLFAQGNFGIVTAAGIELLPANHSHVAFICGIKTTDKLPELIEDLVKLRRDNVIRTIVHIANKDRTRSTLEPRVHEYLSGQGADLSGLVEQVFRGFGEWSAVGALRGPLSLVEAEQRELDSRLRNSDRTLVFLTDETFENPGQLDSAQRTLLYAVEPFYGLTKGTPTDEALKSVTWPIEGVPENFRDLDQTRGGLLYCLPIIPARARDVERVYSIVQQVFGKYNFIPYITLNLLNNRSLEGVINLSFDRSNFAHVREAHACIDELTTALIQEGYPPYRVSIEGTKTIVQPNDVYWQTVRDLKKILDPKNTIAPGRYNIM